MSGFGRKGVGDESGELARRREAFLAAERARKAEAGDDSPTFAATPTAKVSAPNPYRREKTTGMAYLFWFILSMMGAHRFYLGLSASGAAMAGMWMGGWMLVVAGVPFGLIGVAVTAIWAVVDAFLIPGLVRQANAQVGSAKLATAFA